jgi:sugar phosphate isomerase/epimerase
VKIGITYLYTIFRYGYPHTLEDALRSLSDIRKLGFRYLEMEGLGRRMLLDLYRNRQRLLDALEANGLHVHNFCVVDPDLVSLEPARRNPAIERFRLGAEIGALLGAETLHLASYAPPVRYLGGKPYELCGEDYQFVNRTRVRLPRNFKWDRVWQALIDSCAACADIAAEHGKIVLMEPRVGETVCSVDSLLRLMDHVDRPNFKANFDAGHFSAQRENVVLALAKLEGKFANIHLADNDPANADHLPIGDGLIDWEEFFRTLKMMRYDGYLGLDLAPTKSLARGYRRSVERIQALAARLKFDVEI